jgi:hypothetical protein
MTLKRQVFEMSDLTKDFPVITVRREDIAYAIFKDRDELDDATAFNRASCIDGEVMQMIADEMASLYFDVERRYDEFNEWVQDAWKELHLDDELEFPPDTTGSA